MLAIRLQRRGKKKQPFYRLVVCQKTSPPQGKFIEILGNYNPRSKDKKIIIKEERVKYWIGNGAQLSDTANNLLSKIGFLPESAIIKKTTFKKKKKKEEPKPEKPKHIEAPKQKTEAEAGGLLEEAGKEIKEEEIKEKAEEKPEKKEEKAEEPKEKKPAEEKPAEEKAPEKEKPKQEKD